MDTLRIGPFIVEPELGRISGSREIHVEPKAMEVLRYLAAHPGKVLSKQQIIDAVWKDAFVTDDVLIRAIGALRKAFEESPKNPKVIETIPRKGYRLIAPVSCETRLESLAVLPLENLSQDSEQEYFADGMTEALITDLAQISGLKVISRTSVMRYKATRKGLAEIARELDVDVIVEGSVLAADGKVRISAQLIAGVSDQHLWAVSYERELQDILTLQREVSLAISEGIRARLAPRGSVTAPTEEPRLRSRRTVDPEAYEAYLKGMFHLLRFTAEGFDKGLAYLRKAITKDPADPLPYAGLALGYATIAHSPAPRPEALPRAKAAAVQALELDDDLPEAHLALGDVKLYCEWDWIGAKECFRRALDLNPSLAQAHFSYSWYLLLMSRRMEALSEMKRARELDPLQPLYCAWLAGLYWLFGRKEEAIDEARQALELNSDFPPALYVLGWFYTDEKMHEVAIDQHRKLAETSSDWIWALGRTYAAAGRTTEAREIAAKLEEEANPLRAWGLAVIYTALEETDEAFLWLDVAYHYRHSDLPWVAQIPEFKSLSDDPRFHELVRRLELHETL